MVREIKGIKPPEKECRDPNCPWHGKLSIRGRVFDGVVVSDRMEKTVVIESRYFKYHPKYERYSREKTRISVHNPPCVNAKKGDKVRVGECRPIAKTVAHVVLRVI